MKPVEDQNERDQLEITARLRSRTITISVGFRLTELELEIGFDNNSNLNHGKRDLVLVRPADRKQFRITFELQSVSKAQIPEQRIISSSFWE